MILYPVEMCSVARLGQVNIAPVNHPLDIWNPHFRPLVQNPKRNSESTCLNSRISNLERVQWNAAKLPLKIQLCTVHDVILTINERLEAVQEFC